MVGQACCNETNIHFVFLGWDLLCVTELKADVLLHVTYFVFLALPQRFTLITSRIRFMPLSALTSRNWGRIYFKSYRITECLLSYLHTWEDVRHINWYC